MKFKFFRRLTFKRKVPIANSPPAYVPETTSDTWASTFQPDAMFDQIPTTSSGRHLGPVDKDDMLELCQLYISLEQMHQELVDNYLRVEARILMQKDQIFSQMLEIKNSKAVRSRLFSKI